MKITLLGTGSPLPDPNRAGPSTLVQDEGTALLFDCGRGVLMRLAATGVSPLTLSAVLLTHLHRDHITDLNDVITTHWTYSQFVSPAMTTLLRRRVRVRRGSRRPRRLSWVAHRW